jgi:hypothetical protein
MDVSGDVNRTNELNYTTMKSADGAKDEVK